MCVANYARSLVIAGDCVVRNFVTCCTTVWKVLY